MIPGIEYAVTFLIVSLLGGRNIELVSERKYKISMSLIMRTW